MKDKEFIIAPPAPEQAKLLKGFVGFDCKYSLYKTVSSESLIENGIKHPEEFFSKEIGLNRLTHFELLYIAVASKEAAIEVFKYPKYMSKIEQCYMQEEHIDPEWQKTSACMDKYFDYKAEILSLDRNSLMIEVP